MLATMKQTDRELNWSNITRYCMNILIELDDSGKAKI